MANKPVPQGGNQQVTLQVSQGFSGPIPPPDLLVGYERALPGSADRIIRLAEQEQIHRHAREDREDQLQRQVCAHIRVETTLGQVFALIIGVVAICAGTYSATHGAQWSGSVIGGGGVVGLVTAFILGRRRPSKPAAG
jgi:uncharacterized membrane protein